MLREAYTQLNPTIQSPVITREGEATERLLQVLDQRIHLIQKLKMAFDHHYGAHSERLMFEWYDHNDRKHHYRPLKKYLMCSLLIAYFPDENARVIL
ncbi:MAG: hypothetical protein Q8K36_03800, partial [Alphaproteobacteria bacterium]|nr:hypothetical protein [Alphaproteobacteria bacterium]